MSVEDADKIDFTAFDPESDEMLLVISDPLGWGQLEGEHLMALQDKLNAYLAFLEGGQVYRDLPKAVGRKVVIEVVGKFPLSEQASKFYRLAGKVIEDAGFSLRFRHLDGCDTSE
jgi:hypothetical protein